jgi:hypothetical protein
VGRENETPETDCTGRLHHSCSGNAAHSNPGSDLFHIWRIEIEGMDFKIHPFFFSLRYASRLTKIKNFDIIMISYKYHNIFLQKEGSI